MNQEQSVIRVISTIIPAPTDYKTRPGYQTKWRVELDGEVLIESTKNPFEDSAAKLFNEGRDPEALYTMRHHDREYDSFVPAPLGIAAKPGLKRMEALAKMQEYFQNRDKDDDEVEEE